MPHSKTIDEMKDIVDEDAILSEPFMEYEPELQKLMENSDKAYDANPYESENFYNESNDKYEPEMNQIGNSENLEIETEPVFLNNFIQNGSSSEDIQQELSNEISDSAFLKSLTQNIGKPEYLTTTIFEESEEKTPKSDEDQDFGMCEIDNSEDVVNEFEFTSNNSASIETASIEEVIIQ